ncbi:uncharacterized protein At2g39920 [Nicotiana tomentosiformis]|uniref:uncharacterized protein At2g39920 n=1 Tax=Nicotiana tomentosiformis TaxID=4098 RepID=UPI00051C3A63|nr:uncharacterized protein At2g39920 [Nicotiana tomentosiformis]XP_009590463.1 uncharacterized protein At2g39920 [Nicotiana tomentosiformis]XP_009590469.1 uncharacterized protein At2g39920 [Nicotiana tomentosiformis]XP_009590478.1 uncharacterized protein At2g39920 [Nicotiana tomentosiformis]XP_009590486.1 uncharacterized protein At2g39920 [Nicotiana tomentosiformis]XP_018623402.1 uncharacterized protein At2g39920 [Nicotiana tomentosiformis]
MSAYGHMMEREFSAQSLSTRGGSEVGSHYTLETGLYITSFAATVLIAGLVTVGVSLMTLLITLAVMLRSCQTQSAGVVETWKSTDDYNYCKTFVLHAELNLLPSASFPAICKSLAVGYIKDGHYLKDLNITVGLAEQYFSNLKPLPDGCDVVLMDIDDLLPEDSFYPYQVLHRFKEHVCSDCIEDVKYLKHLFFRQLYLILKDGGWKLIFLSRKTERLHNTTAQYLISAGFGGWSSLIMRTDNELQMDLPEYFSVGRTILQKEGFRIVAVISSQMDALTGSSLGRRVFKLPNPNFYFQTGHYTEIRDVLK